MAFNYKNDDNLTFAGYKIIIWRVALAFIGCLATGGILALYFYWNLHRYIKWTHQQCLFSQATKILISNKDGEIIVSNVEEFCSDGTLPRCPNDTPPNRKSIDTESSVTLISENKSHFFLYKFQRFLIEGETVIQVPIYTPQSLACESFVNVQQGLSHKYYGWLAGLHGENVINVPKKSFVVVLLGLVMNPFYVFQAATVVLWSLEEYYIFSAFVVFASLTSLLITAFVVKRQQDKIRRMVAGSTQVKVLRQSALQNKSIEITVNSKSLVPGDLITIERNTIFPCDAVLISGSCVVNEDTLTGESLPVLKVPLTLENIASDQSISQTQHTIFNGTSVIDVNSPNSNSPPMAMVMRTGFSTNKGELIRALVLPKRLDFLFYGDFFKFIICLAIPALLGSVYTFYNFFTLDTTIGLVIIRSLTIFTLVIPPDLPIVLAVSLLLASRGLAKQKIHCIELPRISLAGRISCFCFDKTGTLTNSGLILSSVEHKNQELELQKLSQSQQTGPLLESMSCCHSLLFIDGKLEGDELEKEMFKFTEASLKKDSDRRVVTINETKEFAVVEIFPFVSLLGRMSCMVTDSLTGASYVFCKGAPEVIASLCSKETLPRNFEAQLHHHAANGSRILALAGKQISNNSISREKAESCLQFYGILIFENVCKPETKSAIEELHAANIRVVMITGDHLLTAVHVAKESGIIDKEELLSQMVVDDEKAVSFSNLNSIGDCGTKHLAVTGRAFQIIRDSHPEIHQMLLMRGTIFARMSPDQKASLVQDLKSLDYCVAMCGDGANDCGALKAADVGISLSQAEASVASPFTSQILNISCCPLLIKGGRTALVNTTMMFSLQMTFAILFSFSMVILSRVGSSLSDFAQLYSYFLQVIPLTITMLLANPYPVLNRKKPTFELFRLDLIFKLLCLVFIMLSAMLGAFLMIREQSFYRSPLTFDNKDLPYYFFCYEQVVVFGTMNLEYAILFIILYKGAPYRQPLLQNYLHVAAVSVSFIFSVVTVLVPWPAYRRMFELVQVPRFMPRLYVVLLSLAAGLVSGALIYGQNNSKLYKKAINFIRRKKESRKKYKRLLYQRHNESYRDLNEIA